MDLQPALDWITANPEATGALGTIALGVLGYFGGAFKWVHGLFAGKSSAPPTQKTGAGGVNVGGDNHGTITTHAGKGAEDG